MIGCVEGRYSLEKARGGADLHKRYVVRLRRERRKRKERKKERLGWIYEKMEKKQKRIFGEEERGGARFREGILVILC